MYKVDFYYGMVFKGQEIYEMHWSNVMLGLAIAKRDQTVANISNKWNNVTISEYNKKKDIWVIVRENMETF